MDRILVVDDDVELCELLSQYLSREGFAVDVAHDGDEGVQMARAEPPSLVVLDVMLPGQSGFEALRQIRSSARTPVLMLTARGDDVDRIVGLELGADDYLPKPFNPRELVARIRAVLRRTSSQAGAGASLTVGDVHLDPGGRRATRGGEEVELTAAEFNILLMLLRSAGSVVSREDLAQEALGRPLAPLDRSVDTHVSNVRRKLGPRAGGVERIKSIRGAGYIYTSEAS